MTYITEKQAQEIVKIVFEDEKREIETLVRLSHDSFGLIVLNHHLMESHRCVYIITNNVWLTSRATVIKRVWERIRESGTFESPNYYIMGNFYESMTDVTNNIHGGCTYDKKVTLHGKVYRVIGADYAHYMDSLLRNTNDHVFADLMNWFNRLWQFVKYNKLD